MDLHKSLGLGKFVGLGKRPWLEKAAQVGEIHDWGDGPHKKVAPDKWIKLSTHEHDAHSNLKGAKEHLDNGEDQEHGSKRSYTGYSVDSLHDAVDSLARGKHIDESTAGEIKSKIKKLDEDLRIADDDEELSADQDVADKLHDRAVAIHDELSSRVKGRGESKESEEK